MSSQGTNKLSKIHRATTGPLSSDGSASAFAVRGRGAIIRNAINLALQGGDIRHC